MEVSVLGPVRAVRAGADLPLHGPRERAVLAALALAGPGGTDTDRLVDLVWGDAAPRTAARTVQAYLSRLRGALGPAAVVTDARRHRLVAQVDLWRFRELVDRAHRAPGEARGALLEAVALWRDPVPMCDAPLDGAAVELAALGRSRLDAAELLLAYLDDTQAVEAAETVLAEEPHREGAWLRLATALYRIGRSADALGAVRRARRHLVDDLGLDPAPALVALERDILTHRLGAQRSGTPVPAPLTPLVGRSDLLAEVAARLRASRLVTLVGTGGIGKTRAAVAVAGAAPGSICFAALAGATSARAVEATVLGAVGADPDRGDPRQALVARLSSTVTLLVLDSCEHAVPSVADLVADVLSRCPGVTVLATSRTPLGVAGEALVDVPPLAEEALALFLARASEVTDVGSWTEADRAAAAAVCDLLDGLPLALELTARRLRHVSVPGLLEQVRAGGDNGLAGVVDAGLADLGDAGQLAFRRLGHLRGPVPWDTAAEVAGGDDRVRALVDRSLVVAAEGRVRMYEPVRQHAVRLTPAAERHETQRQVARAVTALTEQAAPHLVGPDELHWLETVDRVHDDVRAVLEWAAAHDDHAVLARVSASVGYLWLLGWGVREGSGWLEQGLAVAEGRDRAQLLVHASLAALRRGEVSAARALGEEGVRRARALRDDVLLGQALHAQAQPDKYAGGAEAARLLLREAVEVRRAVGDLAGTAMSLGALADLAVNLGELDEAAEGYALGLPLMRRSGSPRGLLAYLHSMAELELQRARPAEALALAAQARPLAEQVRDPWHAALLALVEVSAARDLRAPSAEQRQRARDALGACAAQTDPVVTLDGIDAIAGVLLDDGDPAAALRALRASRRLREAHGTPIAAPRRDRRDADEATAARAAALPDPAVDVDLDWLVVVLGEALT